MNFHETTVNAKNEIHKGVTFSMENTNLEFLCFPYGENSDKKLEYFYLRKNKFNLITCNDSCLAQQQIY
jgi:hypothetical protein